MQSKALDKSVNNAAKAPPLSTTFSISLSSLKVSQFRNIATVLKESILDVHFVFVLSGQVHFWISNP